MWRVLFVLTAISASEFFHYSYRVKLHIQTLVRKKTRCNPYFLSAHLEKLRATIPKSASLPCCCLNQFFSMLASRFPIYNLVARTLFYYKVHLFVFWITPMTQHPLESYFVVFRQRNHCIPPFDDSLVQFYLLYVSFWINKYFSFNPSCS